MSRRSAWQAVMLAALSVVGTTVPAAVAEEPTGPYEVQGPSAVTYKTVAQRELRLHVWRPVDGPTDARPGVVFYHGGGWLAGSWDQLASQAEYFASRGLVTVSVEYRTHGPVIAAEDAVDAMNYVFDHNAQLGLDTDRIVAAGASAGGHLALATTLLDLPNSDPTHRLAALALLNPVTDTTGPPARALFLSDEQAREYSPLHHIRHGDPPALLVHGTADTTIPFGDSTRFTDAMRAAGNRADLITYDGQDHGFFNRQASYNSYNRYYDQKFYNRYYYETTRAMDEFLRREGFLTGGQGIRPQPTQLVRNSGFEQGPRAWSVSRRVTEPIHSGHRAAFIDAAAGTTSVTQDVTAALRDSGPGEYLLSAWARSGDAASQQPVVALEVKGNGNERSTRYALPSSTITADAYGYVSGTRRVSWSGELEWARVTISREPTGIRLYVDDVSLEFLPARIGWWRFKPDPTHVAADSSGFELDGSIDGATWTPDGRENGALSFDGNDAVTLPRPFDPATTDFSVSLWLRPTADDQVDRTILGQSGGATWLYRDGGTGRIGTSLGGGELLSGAPVPSDWTHVRLVRHGSELALYVNGEMTTAQVDKLASSTGSLVLGRPPTLPPVEFGDLPSTSVQSGWSGALDELRIHDFAAAATG